MTAPAAIPTGAGRTPLRRWVLPTGLFVVALALALVATFSTRQDHSTTTLGSHQSPVAVPTTEPTAPVSAPARSDSEVDHTPVSISIASIDVATDLVRLGLEPDRTVEVPEDPDQAGWYELGAVPGQTGAAVILGHVDSTEGPAVFHRLVDLVPGARIRVHMTTGDDELFEVSRVETVRNADFPATEVYGSQGRRMLTLVTCGGEYDKARGGYQSNVIVHTEYLGTQRSIVDASGL